jgi:hypothetical protein
MQEAGLKGRKHSALRKMLPLLIGFSFGLAVVLASGHFSSYTNFQYPQSVEGGQQLPTGIEHGYGYPIPYIVHRVYWNLNLTQPWSFTESDEFDLGQLIEGWVSLSVIITLSIVICEDWEKWILKRSRDG